VVGERQGTGEWKERGRNAMGRRWNGRGREKEEEEGEGWKGRKVRTPSFVNPAYAPAVN